MNRLGRSLFVSDIHISSPEDPKYRLFSDFLDRCAEPDFELDHLFLVGDIFDLWVADREYFVDNYHHIIERLQRLNARGAQIHYFEGNHDIDLKMYWQEKLGFEVHDKAAYFQLGPLKVRVEHGDQMDPEDRGYLFLRWLLRTPTLKFLGRNLPNQTVKWIGSRASHASRDYTTTVKAATDDTVRAKVRRHAALAHEERAFDLLVSGHVHVREDWRSESPPFRSINLGTWLKEPLVLELRGKEAKLIPVREFIDTPGT